MSYDRRSAVESFNSYLHPHHGKVRRHYTRVFGLERNAFFRCMAVVGANLDRARGTSRGTDSPTRGRTEEPAPIAFRSTWFQWESKQYVPRHERCPANQRLRFEKPHQISGRRSMHDLIAENDAWKAVLKS